MARRASAVGRWVLAGILLVGGVGGLSLRVLYAEQGEDKAALSVVDRKIVEVLGRECKTVRLWPGTAPDGEKSPAEEKVETPERKTPLLIARNVSDPTITIVRPPKDKDTGAAVVVCPGGGYGCLAFNLEGTEIVDWLNKAGVTGVLLKYRVPRSGDLPKHHRPLQDAQRAVGLLRHQAKELGIRADRIGILGFSAGGHLSATLSNNYQQRMYKAVDEADKVSCRPDFVVLIYPAYLTDPIESDTLDKTQKVEAMSAKDTPPTFIAIAGNDRFARGAVQYYLAMRKAKVPAELHVLPAGGHGVGLREAGYPLSTWPTLCERWLGDLGMLKRDGDESKTGGGT